MPYPSVFCEELPWGAINQWQEDLQHIPAAQRLGDRFQGGENTISVTCSFPVEYL